MRKWFASAGLVVISVVMGVACAHHPKVQAATLLEKGNADVIAALNEFKGKKLSVTGVVIKKDVAEVTTKEISGGVGWGTVRMREHNVRYSFPVLYLEPNGRVACFFPEDALAELAPVQVGSSVTASCTFTNYQTQNGVRLAVLERCQMEESPDDN